MNKADAGASAVAPAHGDREHSLLRRQLRRHFGPGFDIPAEWLGFVQAVGEAYRGFDEDRAMLERSLDLSSRELLSANSEMRAIFQAIPDLLFRLDREGRILSVKAGASDDLLVQGGELAGKRIQDIPQREIGAQFDEAIRRVIAAGKLVRFEYTLLILGIPCDYEARLTPLLGDEVVVIIQNISEQKRAEKALRESEAQLAEAQRTAHLGSWVWHVAEDEIRWSAEMYRIYGITPEEFVGTYDAVMQRIHPDDRADLEETVRNALAERTGFSIEHRILRPDGANMIVHAQGEVALDAAGQVARLSGTALDITKRKNAEAQLLHDALHDHLTGLANRVLLADHLDVALGRYSRDHDAPFALILVDLDRFKNVNDTLGHLVGDQVLKETARRFRASARASDTVARLGGDEFAVLVDGLRGEESPTRVAQRLLEVLAQPFSIDGHTIEIGASLGIVIVTSTHTSPTEVIRDADIALYRAKAAGRGGYQVFDQEMHKRIRERMELEAELRHAVARGEMMLFLQPIVTLRGGTIRSFEALLRWRNPARGFVSPGVFIPIAEETGLILPLGEWVTREACRIIRNWPEVSAPPISINASPAEFLPEPSLSINVSGRELAIEGIDERIARIVAEESVEPASLSLELTESVMINEPVRIGQVLNRLIARGFRIHLDDFGTGYSSLSHLQDLPFSRVKLDRSFTAKLDAGNRTHELMRGIITLAQNIGLEVVAEGVETEGQLSLLRAAGCDHAQGFLFSPPVPVEQAIALYDSGRSW